MQTSLTNLLSISVKKYSHSVIRDFNELEHLVSNHEIALDFAINSNIKVQKNISRDLLDFRKNYSVIYKNNEIIDNKDKSNYFIVSGIMGMKNFVKSIPYFCICASVERDSEIFATAIYNPITNEMFTAEKGMGAFYNNKRLKISPQRSSKINDYSVLATDLSYIKNNKDINSNVRISNCKALDICYLASAKVNNCIFSEESPLHNITPAILIAKEAGYNISITSLKGNNEKVITTLKVVN